LERLSAKFKKSARRDGREFNVPELYGQLLESALPSGEADCK
jgi:hypothetical protein